MKNRHRNQLCEYQWGNKQGLEELVDWDGHIHTINTVYKIDTVTIEGDRVYSAGHSAECTKH